MKKIDFACLSIIKLQTVLELSRVIKSYQANMSTYNLRSRGNTPAPIDHFRVLKKQTFSDDNRSTESDEAMLPQPVSVAEVMLRRRQEAAEAAEVEVRAQELRAQELRAQADIDARVEARAQELRAQDEARAPQTTRAPQALLAKVDLGEELKKFKETGGPISREWAAKTKDQMKAAGGYSIWVYEKWDAYQTQQGWSNMSPSSVNLGEEQKKFKKTGGPISSEWAAKTKDQKKAAGGYSIWVNEKWDAYKTQNGW